MVYLYSEDNKSHSWKYFIVVLVDGQFCNVRKFVTAKRCSASYRVRKFDSFKIWYHLIRQIPVRPPDNEDSSEDELPCELPKQAAAPHAIPQATSSSGPKVPSYTSDSSSDLAQTDTNETPPCMS